MEKKEKTFDDVKKEIRSLLLSSPIGLTPQALLSDYRAMIGKHLPFQDFGYASALDMIKHMPDVVIPVFRPGGTMFLEAVADHTTMHIKKLVLQQKRNGKVSNIRKPQDESVRRPQPKPDIPAIVRMKIKELLKLHPNGVNGSMFGSVFAKRFGRELNFQKYGYSTLKKFFEDCSDIVQMDTQEKDGKKSTILTLKKNVKNSPVKACVVSPNSQEKIEEETNNRNSVAPSVQRSSISSALQPNKGIHSVPPNVSKSTKQSGVLDLEPEDNETENPPARNEKEDAMISTQTGVSDRLKSEIKSLLGGKKNGIWLARFPFEYKKEFKRELDFKASGYLSLIALMGSLPDIVRIDRPVQNGDWLLHGIKAVSRPGIEDPLPKDAVKYDGLIQKMPHPTEGQMEIFIVQVDDPGMFYLHWFKKREALDDLMSKMSDFYMSVPSQSYLLPESHRKTGQLCAAVYDADGEWYRAMILRALSENEVEVVYVDYGNKALVDPLGLRLLRTDFVELPAMCIKGSLAKIKPLQSNWSLESATRFFELTKDKMLLGKIHEVKNNIVSLDLIDVNYSRTVCINDTLVIEKHAAYKNPPVPHPSMYNAGIRIPLQHQPMLPYQNPPFGPMQMTMDSFVQQASTYMDPNQLATMFPYLFTPIQHGQPIFQTQQPVVNPAFHRSASMPASANIGAHQRQDSQVFSEPESIESFINKINSELDDKSSSEESSDDGNFADDEEPAEKPNNVKRIVCGRYKLHIIKYDGTPYATRGEIAALFWHKDILRQMLRQQKVAVPSIVISREDNSDLFNELSKEEIKDLIEDDEIKEFLTLYELESLPLILNTFKHQSEELRKIIDQEISIYKNYPERYLEVDEEESLSESDDDIEEDSMALELELEELRLLLQALQFRRKRLVNSLISKSPSDDKVNELKGVEEDIEKIRKKIQAKEGKFS